VHSLSPGEPTLSLSLPLPPSLSLPLPLSPSLSLSPSLLPSVTVSLRVCPRSLPGCLPDFPSLDYEGREGKAHRITGKGRDLSCLYCEGGEGPPRTLLPPKPGASRQAAASTGTERDEAELTRRPALVVVYYCRTRLGLVKAAAFAAARPTLLFRTPRGGSECCHDGCAGIAAAAMPHGGTGTSSRSYGCSWYGRGRKGP